MNQKQNKNHIEELGKMFDSHMKNINSANKSITVELGVINPNFSLKVASLGNSIPKGDYMVSLHLKVVSIELETNSVELTTDKTEDHEHTIDGHKHEFKLPSQLRGLKAGDRVLVAWVGTEPIVIDIVVSS